MNTPISHLPSSHYAHTHNPLIHTHTHTHTHTTHSYTHTHTHTHTRTHIPGTSLSYYKGEDEYSAGEPAIQKFNLTGKHSNKTADQVR